MQKLRPTEFPDWFTIDTMGLNSLNYCLDAEFAGETVKISVEREKKEVKDECSKTI